MTYKDILYRRRAAFVAYAILVIIYGVLTLAFPPIQGTEHLLHINSLTYRLLIFLLELPYVFIWFLAFFAYVRLHLYSRKIRKSREGGPFMLMAQAIVVMAWGLAIQGIISAVLSQIAAAHPGFKDASDILGNYVTLVIVVIAFTIFASSTRRLNDILHVRPNLQGTHLLILIGIVFGVLFCYLSLSSWYVHRNPYHLPLYLTLFTVIVPYLYAWFIGMFAVYELIIYSYKARGLFYRRALASLAVGVIMIIISSIFTQYLTVVLAGRTSFALGLALIILYLFLIIEGVGFVLVAYGANRLKRIEDI